MKIRYLALWVCGFALACGCQPDKTPDAAGSAEFGRFEGDVVASWDDDGRNMTLKEDFVYVDPRGRRWIAPAESVVNGASIPAGFWTFIGGPFEGKYRKASVVHDVECVEMTASWEEVHRMFYESCLCGGVDESKAKMLYYAVYHFGPRWQPVTETSVERQTNAEGETVEVPVSVQRMVRLDPPPPTLEEVEQVEALIEEENPELSEITKTSRQALHRRPRRGPGGRGRPHDGSGGPPSPREDPDGPPSPREGVERPSRLRPEGAGDRHISSGNRPQGGPRRGVTGGERPWHKNGQGEWGGLRFAEQPQESALPDVTPQEQQWAQQQVRDYLEQQTGEARPAEYEVERTKDGFRIFVQYIELDEQGQPTGAAGGKSIVRLSPDGQVQEMISGM